MQAPGAFLDLAEETGHIVPIGWWVLDEACRGMVDRPVTAWVSVNLSMRQLHEPGAVETVAAILGRTGLDRRRLVLEVTERALAEGAELVDRLARLRALAIRVAIAGLATPEGEVLVRAVVELAGALGMKAVAEGVEDHWPLDKVIELGCDGAQGYLLGRPAPHPVDVPAVSVPTLHVATAATA